MGVPTYLYHAEHGAQIFDSEDMPGEAEGWFDSRKKFQDLHTVTKEPEPVLSGEFPDPRPFSSIKAYISAVDPTIPKLPDEPKAFGMDDDAIAALSREIGEKSVRALRHYAKLKHGTVFDDGVGASRLFDECSKLDKRALKAL